jgi:LytS/YehU family sensor histidine kinase
VHPILGDRGRLAIYLVTWLPLGALLALLLEAAHGIPRLEAFVLMVPLTDALGFVCLSAFYLCRAAPLVAGGLRRAFATQAVGAAVTSALWILVSEGYAQLLARVDPFAGADQRLAQAVPLLAALGMLFYLLTAAIHYVLIAVEHSHAAARTALEASVLSKEAELRALRAQLQPHFLFNSLNSISALTTADPEGARRMCLLLGDFLRQSLRLGARQAIALADELALVERFLAIEKVRFGRRLAVEIAVEDAARTCELPPLLLQPLVENAVAHGIAGLVDGGTVRIEARRSDDRLLVAVENPRDPDSSRRGEGVGLDNVRRRLDASFGREARMDVLADAGRFRVELRLPLPGAE